jgi:hypothetical protein
VPNSDDSIRKHIETAASRAERETRHLTDRIVGACWPGGVHDRSEPMALNWIRRWRPARSAAPLPACSCAAGRCAVCN